MTRRAHADDGVVRRDRRSTGVSGDNVGDAGEALEDGLDAPETSPASTAVCSPVGLTSWAGRGTGTLSSRARLRS